MGLHRLPNTLAEGTFLLPFCLTLSAALWFVPEGSTSWTSLAAWLLSLLVAYVLMETNNSNQLIRVRTRMVASVWLVMTGALVSLHTAVVPWLAALALSVSHYTLFRSYQKHEGVVDAFHALLMLSLASLLEPHLLGLAPLYLWYIGVFMRAMSPRVFWASAVGLALPYLFVATYSVVAGDYAFFRHMVATLSRVQPVAQTNYQALSPRVVATWALPSVLGLIAVIHYLENYYNDKIRTRMLLYVFVAQGVAIEIFVVLQPMWIETLAPSMVAVASPLIAHLFALGREWWLTPLFALTLAGIALTFALQSGAIFDFLFISF